MAARHRAGHAPQRGSEMMIIPLPTHGTRASPRNRHAPDLLEQLPEAGPVERERLVAALAEQCRPDVLALYRRSGKSLDEAEELTQAFFAEVILGRGLFARACERRGSLRALVATAARRFAIDRHRAERRDVGAVRLGDEPLPDFDPDPSTLDRDWAIGVISEAVRRCRHQYAASGRAAHWDLFEARVLHGLTGTAEPRPYAELARRYGFETERRAAAAVQGVRRTLAAGIRARVREGDSSREPGVPAERRLLDALTTSRMP